MGTFNPFSTPFASLDGVVGPGITFGGGIGYQGDHQELKDAQTVDLSAFVVAPRVGFIQEIGKVVSVWLRGGVTYSSQKAVTTQAVCPFSSCGPPTTQAFSMLDLSVDPTFVFTPFPHLGILLGPTVDVALAGTETFEPIVGNTDPNSPAITPEREFRLSSFGAAASVALFF
jgi:hypothetical protein